MIWSSITKRFRRHWMGATALPVAMASFGLAAGLAQINVVVVPKAMVPPSQASRGTEDSPQALLAQGEYEKAITESEAILGRSPDQPAATATLSKP